MTAILESSSCTGGLSTRPLETLKGVKLSGVHALSHGKHADEAFFHAVKRYAPTLTRVELAGWHDMDDLRKLASALPCLAYLDVGKRLGLNTRSTKDTTGPVTNLEEWFEVIATLPDLGALHGVKLFYEISSINLPQPHTNSTHQSQSALSNAAGALSSSAGFAGDRVDATVIAKIQSQMSLMDRSRMKKNDWTASMLVWRCPKLRRVDHWDEGGSRVVVLSRTCGGTEKEIGADTHLKETGYGKVRWEVRKANSKSM